MSLSELILVDEDLFGRIERTFLAAIDGILLNLFIAVVIPVTIVFVGYRLIGLFDAADDLFVEFFLERFGVFQFFLEVTVFGVEVVEHFGGLRIFGFGVLLGV